MRKILIYLSILVLFLPVAFSLAVIFGLNFGIYTLSIVY